MIWFDWSVFPALDTERVHLRALDREDSDALFLLRADALSQHYEDGPPFTRLDQAFIFIEQAWAAFYDHRSIIWAVAHTKSGSFIGTVSLNALDFKHQRATLHYNFNRDVWAFAEGAVAAVVRFGFEQLSLNRLSLDLHAAHLAGLDVAQRVSFLHEATHREHYLQDGLYVDQLRFALFRRQWIAQAAGV
jgi:[ribosomal protein S5]-alanine N-acetyltransferase